MKPRLQLAVCPSYAAEFRAAVARLGLNDVDVDVVSTTCLGPANAHASDAGDDVPRRWLACSPPSGRVARPGEEVVPLEQCFHLVAGPTLTAELQRGGAYLVTPGWVRHWLDRVAKWGFDQAGARAFFGESMKEIVLLDTGVDPEADARARQFAEFVGLPLRRLGVGLDHLVCRVEHLVDRWRHRLELERAQAALGRSQRQSAELAMALDLLRHLANAPTEVEAVQRVRDIILSLFAPRTVTVLLVHGSEAGELLPPGSSPDVRLRLLAFAGAGTPQGVDGFLVRFAARGETVAVAEVAGLAFPERRDDYLDLAISLSELAAGAIQTARQVTRQREVELELRQAQKLESVGRLASGIAHEINTPVQFIGDNLAFLKDAWSAVEGVTQAGLALGDRVREGRATAAQAQVLSAEAAKADLDFVRQNVPVAFTQVEDGLARIATIVRSMREFAHPGGAEMEQCDLERSLRTTLDVARNEYKYVATVETRFGGVPPTFGYPAELNQVFLNLLVNAAHAIGAKVGQGGPKGVITVRTFAEAAHLVVAISDTGTGIPKAAREHVFEQFFTTKELGKGTGQGLAIAWRVVVERHGGTLTFETEEGQGTTFFVRLPLRTERAAAAPLP